VLGVEVVAALWTGRGLREVGDIILTEVAMSVEGDGALVVFEDRVPDAIDGFVGDSALDQGGRFEHNLEPVGVFRVRFDGFGADASDG